MYGASACKAHVAMHCQNGEDSPQSPHPDWHPIDPHDDDSPGVVAKTRGSFFRKGADCGLKEFPSQYPCRPCVSFLLCMHAPLSPLDAMKKCAKSHRASFLPPSPTRSQKSHSTNWWSIGSNWRDSWLKKKNTLHFIKRSERLGLLHYYVRKSLCVRLGGFRSFIFTFQAALTSWSCCCSSRAGFTSCVALLGTTTATWRQFSLRLLRQNHSKAFFHIPMAGILPIETMSMLNHTHIFSYLYTMWKTIRALRNAATPCQLHS